jgi:hypothetical protein
MAAGLPRANGRHDSRGGAEKDAPQGRAKGKRNAVKAVDVSVAA